VGSRSYIHCWALRTQKQCTQDRSCSCAAVIFCMLIVVSLVMSSLIVFCHCLRIVLWRPVPSVMNIRVWPPMPVWIRR
jgi:hypothetical protein